jgi:Alcohol dehydrogenase GroES-like domain
MKAFVVEKYGPSGLRPADVTGPTVGPQDVLVRVRAAGINPLDKIVRNGEFKLLLKYKTPFVLGHDLAGVVTQVGADVRHYKVGDEVYSRPRDLRIRPSPSGTWAHMSPPLPAGRTRGRCAASAQTKLSTIQRQTSPSRSPATTSCSTPWVATPSRSR